MAKIDRLRLVGTFESRDDAARSLAVAGDMALVKRGILRLLLIRCPCCCGDDLVINLDSRSGPAWRCYLRNDRVTLYPSYWRDSACESHFILWSNRLHWCTWDRDEDFWTDTSLIQDRVLKALTEHFVAYQDIAESLGEIPWDVLQACHDLVRKGVAEANSGRRRGEFRKLQQTFWGPPA